ncbi:MAG: hypothetical protein M3Y09_01560 [Actinomycetota bacterium]|nr:hypothetical protein [Actinomycetota bacterium]
MQICDLRKSGLQRRCQTVAYGGNALGLAAAAVFAAVGVVRPNFSDPGGSEQSLTRFWAASSAVRTWAMAGGLATAIRRDQRASPELLAVAALGDSALGVWQRNVRMAMVPALMAIVHLRSARVLFLQRGHS